MYISDEDEGNVIDLSIDKKPPPRDDKLHTFLYGRAAYAHFQRFMQQEDAVLYDINMHHVADEKKDLIKQRKDVEDALEAAKGINPDIYLSHILSYASTKTIT